jgi:hypothetical protein
VLDRVDLREQRLLREAAFVGLAQALLGPDDLVDEDGEHEEHRREADDEGRGEVRQDRIGGPELHVAKRPERGGEPDDHDVHADRLEPELDDRRAEERRDRVADAREEVEVHAASSPM